MKHLKAESVSPVSGHRTRFTLWHTTNEEKVGELNQGEYLDRGALSIDTGAACLNVWPTEAECRELAAHLLSVADRIANDKRHPEQPRVASVVSVEEQ